MKETRRAVLPFTGQKKNFITEFKEVISEYDDSYTFIDVFGGSGLLGKVVSEMYPDARVIVNDYDNYKERLDNVEATNELLNNLCYDPEEFTKLKKKQKYPPEMQSKMLEIIEDTEEKYGFVDYITLTSKLLFSGEQGVSIDDFKNTYFYKRTFTPYDVEKCLTWYDDVERIVMDYRDILATYKDIEKVVFIADPPYLGTMVNSYQINWLFQDYIDVIDEFSDLNLIFFTSNKSKILELNDFIISRGGEHLFPQYKEVYEKKTTYYVDYMIHINKKNEAGNPV